MPVPNWLIDLAAITILATWVAATVVAVLTRDWTGLSVLSPVMAAGIGATLALRQKGEQ